MVYGKLDIIQIICTVALDVQEVCLPVGRVSVLPLWYPDTSSVCLYHVAGYLDV